MTSTATEDDMPRRPSYASYLQTMRANARIREALADLHRGAEASSSRDFGRGVAHAARYLEAALETEG